LRGADPGDASITVRDDQHPIDFNPARRGQFDYHGPAHGGIQCADDRSRGIADEQDPVPAQQDRQGCRAQVATADAPHGQGPGAADEVDFWHVTDEIRMPG
jgi:hypothetical protein